MSFNLNFGWSSIVDSSNLEYPNLKITEAIWLNKGFLKNSFYYSLKTNKNWKKNGRALAHRFWMAEVIRSKLEFLVWGRGSLHREAISSECPAWVRNSPLIQAGDARAVSCPSYLRWFTFSCWHDSTLYEEFIVHELWLPRSHVTFCPLSYRKSLSFPFSP